MSQLIPKRFEELFDRNFGDILGNFVTRSDEFNHLKQIRLDIKEDDAGYTVHAELPGVKKEDINVQIDGNMLSIEAESKQEKEEKEGEKVLHKERYYGKISRAVRLAQEVDQDKAQASYQDGILELVLPKKVEQASNRRLEIK